MIGETTAPQSRIEVSGPVSAPATMARAEFRSGTPGRRAQDARAQDAAGRMRAPIFDLRATNRQAPRQSQPLESGRAPEANAVQGSTPPPVATITAGVGLRSLAPAGYGERNSLRRPSVIDAYLSAEMLDGPYARRGSVFDLQI